jgi:uncharacterized membrane protein (UPF0127 family)
MSLLRTTLARLGSLVGSSRSNVPLRRLRIINQSRGIVLATMAELADTAPARSKGLLGRNSLAKGEALWIVPCESVHTFFMRFALDLVYLDRSQRIVKIRTNVPPWRLSACFRAHSIIEFAAGQIDPRGAAVGDQLVFEPAGEEQSAESV